MERSAQCEARPYRTGQVYAYTAVRTSLCGACTWGTFSIYIPQGREGQQNDKLVDLVRWPGNGRWMLELEASGISGAHQRAPTTPMDTKTIKWPPTVSAICYEYAPLLRQQTQLEPPDYILVTIIRVHTIPKLFAVGQYQPGRRAGSNRKKKQRTHASNRKNEPQA